MSNKMHVLISTQVVSARFVKPDDRTRSARIISAKEAAICIFIAGSVFSATKDDP
jgi:hypothetical protein